MIRAEGHLGGYVYDDIEYGTYCTEVWDWLINECKVRSMVDIGCGLGHTLKYFGARGCDVLGIDGSVSAIEDNEVPGSVRRHDYTKDKLVIDKAYDMIWSAEFVEHVEEKYIANFMETFKAASKYILITHATPGQGGYHHVNEQPRDYWLDKFSEIGFAEDVLLTNITKDMLPPERGWYYKNNGIFLVRNAT